MEACLVGANHSPSILATNESRPVVVNCELRNVSLPREADPLGQEHPIFLTDISTNIPTEAKSEDENRVHVATLDDCRGVKSADCVMTPTQAMLEELRQYVEVPDCKAVVNPYGVEPPDSKGTKPVNRVR